MPRSRDWLELKHEAKVLEEATNRLKAQIEAKAQSDTERLKEAMISDCEWKVGDQFTMRDSKQVWEVTSVEVYISTKTQSWHGFWFKPPSDKGHSITIRAAKVLKTGNLSRTKSNPSGVVIYPSDMAKATKV